MTVCGEAKPSRPGSGLKTRTLDWPRRPHATELELRERGAGEVLRGALHEVELRHAVVEAAREPVRRDRHSAAALAARDCGDAVDDRLTGGGNPA